MRSTTSVRDLAPLAALWLSACVLFASVPAGAVIIDLDAHARTDLEHVWVPLPAGTYDVTPIGPSQGGGFTAWNAYGVPAYGCDANGAHCEVGWQTRYSFVSERIPNAAYWDSLQYETPALALAHGVSTTFTLPTANLVGFYIDDSNYSDNVGGVSLLVSLSSAGVPEERSAAALGLRVFPNPLSSCTAIRFALDREAQVEIAVFDIHGRQAAAVAGERMQEGVHEFAWRGVNDAGDPVPPGVYFVRVTVDRVGTQRRIVLLH
jgi:hypothetical protein